ncbi:MAG TPA: glyoxalase superfamily protein, partial [Polyangiaceae bacterium]|nr:glyoxalase superfamily protein [Polyangiaceae bacterium]
MRFAAPVPILRMFDLDRAKEFYVGFLGFQVDWEHRFEPVAPVYMQVSRGECRIHLSEHHGDGTPGTAIRVEMPDEGELESYQKALLASGYKYYRP